ncbi:uncharacterized protein LOC124931850 [Impatiens glandulifera]|uniref:uncharacterized protein LOC124931850 n=1 Tax=Impatiens glandulifera TaxID=253017 RepID=UPI001FB07FB2|nr:uncharacterized protein LOC124931850 [Impatiens glandulifera]
MAEQAEFLQPLIIPKKPNTAALEPDLSNSAIILRLTSVFFVAILSFWANHEASKGIDIVIENAAKNTPAGRRFNLFYLSNDKASRLAIQASDYIQHLLYSDLTLHKKKQVSRVTVRLVLQNLTEITEVSSSPGSNNRQFLIQISFVIMDRSDHMSELIRILQRAMARVWIYDNGPKHVVDGIVELLANSPDLIGGGGGDCWMMDEDIPPPRQVARFLEEGERQRKGFIQRLNQGMRDGWSDRTVDIALGLPARNLCGTLPSQ